MNIKLIFQKLRAYNMKKVLIIGANSFLSIALIERWKGKGEITVIYHSKAGELAVEYVSLADLDLLADEFDFIFIVSAFISNDTDHSKSLFRINVNLVQKISEKFKSGKLIYFSSVAVFDALNGVNINNQTTPSPMSVYGISKLWAEKIIEKHGNYGIIRISSMYGVGMKENTFLPAIANKAISNNQIELFGDGSRRQNYIHVEDVVSLAMKIGASGENILLLAINPTDHANSDVAHIISQNIPCDVYYSGVDEMRSVTYEENHPIWKSHKFRTLEEGIKEIIKWKKNQF